MWAYSGAESVSLGRLRTEPPVRLGLVGTGIGHSLSPTLHVAGLHALGIAGSYERFEAAGPREALAVIDRLRRGELAGLNVTTPFKGLAASELDVPADDVASQSANTLWMRDGRLCGGSSDGPGLLLALAAVGIQVRGLRVGLLGAGGVASAVTASFVAAGAQIVWVVARDPVARARVAHRCGAAARAWDDSELPAVDLCIQATRIGHGAVDDRALADLERAAIETIGPALWQLDALFVDLVVARHGDTPWQRSALNAGLPRRQGPGRGVLSQSGAAMLAAQAAISLGWWTNAEPQLRPMATAIGVDWFDAAAAPRDAIK